MADPRRKNISKEIRDIRFPTSHVPDKPAISEKPRRNIKAVPRPPREPVQALPARAAPSRGYSSPVRRPLAVLLAVVLLAGVISGVLWYRGTVAQADRLRGLLSQVFHIQDAVVPSGLPDMGPDSPTTLGGWLALFKETLSGFNVFKNASWGALGALNEVGRAAEELPGLLLRRDGPGTVAALTALRDGSAALYDALSSAGEAVEAGGGSALADLSGYLGYAPDVKRAEIAADRLLALLTAPGEHHVLVLFGNSAELRPGGGFLGSFADVSFGDSEIRDITVHDINEVDRGLTADIVPPRQMQGLVSRWRSADANWFFDYPDSAEKTLQMMERSSFYASSSTSGGDLLEGAMLISPQVVQDLLSATGPLTLADGTEVTAENIVRHIQNEVQEGQASGAEAPKAVLSELVPLLLERLDSLGPEAQERLLLAAQNWLRHRHLAIYMRDPELGRILSHYDLDGGIYPLPQKFLGDYLAAVNTNIGGGKSDAFIVDDVEIVSDLRADGLIQNRVTVVRTSQAGASEPWWYKVTNQDHLRVFTPPDVALVSAAGALPRSITPRSSYGSGWETDPDVAALEATLRPVPGFPAVSQFRESGRNVFAAWLSTPAGGTSALTMEYRRSLGASFQEGQIYTFIYERQSGAEQSLHAVINAPPGFVWQETGSSKYEYVNLSVPGRVVVELTLAKF